MVTAKFKQLKLCLAAKIKNILATANKERVEVYHDPKEQKKRPTVFALDALVVN